MFLSKKKKRAHLLENESTGGSSSLYADDFGNGASRAVNGLMMAGLVSR